MNPFEPKRRLLTIAIPTYNRSELLKVQLTRLVPQLTPEVVCWVFDNASEDSTTEAVRPFLEHGIRYYRSPCNYGPTRNFVRCFEECDTDWLWLLSDDDAAHPEAVSRILNVVRNNSNGFILTSDFCPSHPKESVAPTVRALLDSAPLGPLFFISIMLFNTTKLRPYFNVLTELASTYASQLALVLIWMERTGGTAMIAPINVLADTRTVNDWSTLKGVAGLSQLPGCLKNEADQRTLAMKVLSDCYTLLLILGLRETHVSGGIRRWKRAYRQTLYQLRCYGIPFLPMFVLRNFFRYGSRRTCLDLALIWLLAKAPAPVFRWIRPRLAARHSKNSECLDI